MYSFPSMKDKYNQKISHIELLRRNSNESEESNYNITKFFLRTGRPGHLFLKPNYTAFTKTNLGSIPSKLEKALIKTDTNKSLSKVINNTMPMFNSKNELKTFPREEKDIRKYTTSFSSKGFGIGFVSKVSRFGESLSGYEPGPADYSPEKNFTLLSKVEKSPFGKSFFKEKTSISLSSYNNDTLSKTSFRSFTSSRNNKNVDLNYNETNKEKPKGTYYFNSTSDRFNGGIFSSNNKNPGPGKYFFDTNNIIIKDKNKLSSGFIEAKKKIINPIKFFDLNKNEKEKLGYHLTNKTKKGKIKYVWKGLQYTNNDELLNNNKKFDKSSISLANNSTKITSVFTNNYNNSSNIPSLFYGDKKSKFNYSKTEYLSISPDNNNNSIVSGFEESKIRNSKYVNNIKQMIKNNKKESFTLTSPRWDLGYFHDNASHFQVPGPAYYDPRLQKTKKSFNLNNKDFIFTNSLPFKNGDYYSTSSVII